MSAQRYRVGELRTVMAEVRAAMRREMAIEQLRADCVDVVKRALASCQRGKAG